MMKFLSVFFFASLVVCAPVFAGEHLPQKISGPQISLFERDHAFAGEILGTPVFGVFEHEPFGSKVQMRVGNKTLELSIQTSLPTGRLGGTIKERLSETEEQVTQIDFLNSTKTGDKSANLTYIIDSRIVVVAVEAPTFSNGHFHSPTFSTHLNGSPLSFSFTGEACMGYSANMAIMILGAYAHLSK